MSFMAPNTGTSCPIALTESGTGTFQIRALS
jgi:hypothetical protein